MKVTLNNQNFQPNYSNLQSKNILNYTNQPSFEGVAAIPSRSKFMSSFKSFSNEQMKNFYDAISKYYTKPLSESGLVHWLSQQTWLGKVVNHMQFIGSTIISGMYMTQTLRSDMDEETKKKLALNQGLTWAVSSIGAYATDNALDSMWEKKVNAWFAKKYLLVEDLPEKFKKYSEEYKENFFKNPKNKDQKFRPASVIDFLKKNPEFKNQKLISKIEGLNVLKSLVVFTTIYRFVTPVAVTPLANKVGNKLFGKKEQKSQFTAQTANIPNMKTPNMVQFANRA